MRDIIYKPLYFIYGQISSGSEACDDEKCDVLFICCDILNKILEATLPLCHQELALYLSIIISNIIPLVDLREDIKGKCEEIIDCIFIRNADILQAAILKMDPLPEKPSFQNANKAYNMLKSNASSGIYSVLEEIDLFSKVSQFNRTVVSFRGCNSRSEALRRLHIQLSGDCHRLKLLIADPSQEPGVSRLLYQLVEDLLKLATSSDYVGNADFEMELAKCIGTLGLMNLPCDGPVNGINAVDSSSKVLSDILSCFPNDVKMQQYCQIFHALNSYLVDPDVALVSATCDVLKSVLSTKAGKHFVSVYKSRLPDDRLFLYLHPFLSHKEQRIVLSDKSDEFAARVDNDVLWNSSQISHRNWIQGLLSALLNSGCVQDEVLRWLNPVCQVQTDFCELVLPFVFHNILSSDAGQMKYRKILSERLSNFLKRICRSQTPPSSSHSVRKDGQLKNTESVRTLLNVVQYLRLQEKTKNDTSWSSNFWLDVDYHYLAKAALICSASYTSLLYSEIAQLQNGRYTAYDFESCGDPSSAVTAGNIDIQDILLEAYRSISDSDSIYGCAISKRHTDHSARTKMYEHEGNWMKALTSHDLSINQSSDQSSLASYAGLLKSLQNLGCDHLLDVYLKGLLEMQRERRCGRICGESSLGSLCHGMQEERGSKFRLSTEADIQEIQYQAAYRSCRWDLEIPNRLDGKINGYNQLICSCMVGLKQKDRFLVAEGVTATRQMLLESLSNRTREENESNVFPALYKLRSISEIELFADALILRSDNDLNEILMRWNEEQSAHKQEYEHIEPLLMQRCTMLQLACSDRPKCEALHNALTKSLQMVATAAREAGRYQVAESALLKLDALSNEGDFPASFEWRIEKAKLFWAKGEEDNAKYLLKELIKELPSDDNSVSQLYGHCLVMYGNWLAKTRSKSPSVILDRYIEKGTKLLEESGCCNEETVVDAFLSFARYADAQHQVIVDYMKSYTFEAKQSLIRQAEEDMGHMKRMGEAASADMCRYFRTLEKQRQIDEEELKRLVSDREKFLMYALQNYIKCLQNHDCHDRYIYRLVSLWFNNMKSQSVNQIIKDGVLRIKSHKFISLMYQLAARMSYKPDDDAGEFIATLTQLIESVVADHPHHCLSIIFSLANAKLDTEMPRARSRGRSSTAGGSQDTEMEEDRVLAAKKMLKRLQKKKGNGIGKIVADLERLCSAYIQLANCNVDRYKGETKPISLPDSLAITQIKNLENVAVMTVDAPVDPTCEYKDIISVIGFQSTFTLAGGINLPKIISCQGSDGVSRRQLVKGRDDLRQDAVMQQVFMMVNNLLEKNLETRKRRLNVRTYKVVPLSQRSGILEWCEGTLPMGEYLIGSSNGAHQRYRPLDWKAMDCRKQLAKVHAEGSDRAKYDTYQEICKKFRPVFHNFFMERYRHPVEWYHKRLSYTRSVATNSIVGYILGLGDRHVQNILIDTQTAELIHIDLGVAFEQGRILPTPETVPFRLTRDIVDGMGVTGVEGVFRRCCEKTMEVMHSSEEVIITILQVLLYDPLYSWTMSNVKACQLQSNKTIDICPSGDVLDASGVVNGKKGDCQDNVNKVAERVLLRLKQKLHGMENGVQLSISGQVNHLIQEATDPKNLCRLFPGWQAYI